MIKRLVSAALFAGLMIGPAFAQTTPPTQPAQPAPEAVQPVAALPQSAEECIKAATELALSAEDKKLGEDKIDKLDDLLTKMETHCDAKQFVEAMAVAKDIKTMIETQ